MNRDEIIVHIFTNDNIERYCRKLYFNEWEELRSELIIQLYKMKLNKLIAAHDNNFLEYLCFTICKRIKLGNIKDTGVFHKKADWNELGDVADDDIEIEIDKSEMIRNMVDGEHWYSKTLFCHYYIDGYNLREISSMYGINIKSIHYSINKLKNKIKERINGNTTI